MKIEEHEKSDFGVEVSKLINERETLIKRSAAV